MDHEPAERDACNRVPACWVGANDRWRSGRKFSITSRLDVGEGQVTFGVGHPFHLKERMPSKYFNFIRHNGQSGRGHDRMLGELLGVVPQGAPLQDG